MERLIAKRPILYQGRQYEPGEPLPASDTVMVGAWLRAKSAEMASDTTAAVEPETPVNDPDNAQDSQNDQGGTEDQNGDNAAQNGQSGHDGGGNTKDTQGTGDGATGDQGGQNGTEEPPDMVEGHLDVKKLERMTTAQLEKLAADMGVDISGVKSNKERAALIAAVPVKAPANEGGAQ